MCIIYYIKYYCITSNVQTDFFKNTLQKFGKIVHSFALIFPILVIWHFNTFRIPYYSL